MNRLTFSNIVALLAVGFLVVLYLRSRKDTKQAATDARTGTGGGVTTNVVTNSDIVGGGVGNSSPLTSQSQIITVVPANTNGPMLTPTGNRSTYAGTTSNTGTVDQNTGGSMGVSGGGSGMGSTGYTAN